MHSIATVQLFRAPHYQAPFGLSHISDAWHCVPAKGCHLVSTDCVPDIGLTLSIPYLTEQRPTEQRLSQLKKQKFGKVK